MDLAVDLVGKSSNLTAWLNPKTAESLSSIVRMMNCYYSNLIEGHNTKLQDIERALNSDFEDDEKKRNLQIEALDHIRVQRKIDQMHLSGDLGDPTSIEFILWLHKEFYNDATDSMLAIKNNNRSILMEPGIFRSTAEHNVVGRHQPPSGQHVEAFMRYFENRYNQATGKSRQIMASASARHRLAYIHPFLDGNGRVCRLMSHAMGLQAGIGASGLWSISRGLARGLETPDEYKRMMSLADMKRQDGRGSLSLRALVDFTNWFLKLSIDQVDFMTSLFERPHLKKRLESYVKLKELKPESMYILEAVLSNGEIPRGDAVRMTGHKERSARTILSKLTDDGILSSDTPKGPVSLRFDLDSSRILFPKLFTDFTLGT
ncbi:Fic family protein [Bathymodiolus platifrons methanotrophic gill symbiont]|uniref:Fic family protein n=1 Tax=Bathymodiolus platifrons methanotrophic gill symbiont TaxID=113268 RepID=UPI001FCCD837|nr:Fic family protein [Bathymodiolus platifrons methanotrophic gill symbiont]